MHCARDLDYPGDLGGNMDYITERSHRIFQIAHHGGMPTPGDAALYRMYAVLSFAKGADTTAQDVHDAWSAWIAESYPEHRSLKPFSELSEETKRMDDLYVDAIHAAAKEA
jgi:hypothetical protein